MRRLGLILALALVAGCAPLADSLVPVLERDKAASLTVADSVWTFDPGDRVARGAILLAEGPEVRYQGDACHYVQADLVLRCDLGDVSEAVSVTIEGVRIIATVTYRRTGSNQVYAVFFREE